MIRKGKTSRVLRPILAEKGMLLMSLAHRQQVKRCNRLRRPIRRFSGTLLLVIPLLMTVAGCATTAATLADDAPNEADKLASIEMSVRDLEKEREQNRQELFQLRTQLAELQQKTLQLQTDLDRIEKLVVARYEEYLKQDREVLNELDQVLGVWLETIEESEGQDGAVADRGEQRRSR